MASKLFSYSQGLRRDFHSHPELGFKEIRTSRKIAEELKNMGFRVMTGLAETGVKAIIGHGDPVIMLRFDMDALPIQEENEIDYRSQNAGIMHACGHDGHMAIGLTVARLIVEFQKHLKGTVVLIFQPAEEGLGGCERMIAEGVLDDPKPAAAFGVHIWNEQPIGWIGIKPGAVMAGSDIFSVKVTGVGGHGAIPQNTRDPLLCGAQIITALQSIVSRNIGALDSGVVSVTKFIAGETFNVIPSWAEFNGTIRYFEPEVHKIIRRRFSEIVLSIAKSSGCEAEIDIKKLTPALRNDPKQTLKVIKSSEALSRSLKIDQQFQTMGSEDFAYILEKIPGCYFFIGSADKKMGLTFRHHNSRFNFSEIVMTDAAAILVHTVLNY